MVRLLHCPRELAESGHQIEGQAETVDADGRLPDGFVPFINTFAMVPPVTITQASYASVSVIVMATSGHMMQHRVQWMQSSGRAW